MKCLIALVLLVSSFAVAASYYLERSKSRDGRSMVRVVNQTPGQIYCWVRYNNGYGFFDFYVAGNSRSRWYYEPVGYYEYGCN